mgnify:CR=1 FL=1
MPVNTKLNEAINDLKLIIDLSCSSLDTLSFFKEFHSATIRALFKATDVLVDYNKSSIWMNIPIEPCKGDFLNNFDQQAPISRSVTLKYISLGDFLKENLDEIGLRFDDDFSGLHLNFSKGRNRQLALQKNTKKNFSQI